MWWTVRNCVGHSSTKWYDIKCWESAQPHSEASGTTHKWSYWKERKWTGNCFNHARTQRMSRPWPGCCRRRFFCSLLLRATNDKSTVKTNETPIIIGNRLCRAIICWFPPEMTLGMENSRVKKILNQSKLLAGRQTQLRLTAYFIHQLKLSKPENKMLPIQYTKSEKKNNKSNNQLQHQQQSIGEQGKKKGTQRTMKTSFSFLFRMEITRRASRAAFGIDNTCRICYTYGKA